MRVTKERTVQVLRLFHEGWGQRSIHRITGISESTVVRILRGQHRYNQRRFMRGKRPGKELQVYQ